MIVDIAAGNMPADSSAPFTAREVERFALSRPPVGFLDDPYPWYAALREHDPAHRLEDGSLMLTRYDDVVAVYRSADASSDKRSAFGPKFGDSLLFEHHTSSLVFNDPPLHTRVRRRILGALSQRAIARMEGDVDTLVQRLLATLEGRSQADLIDDFAARIPVEVIGNLLGVPRAEREPLRGWSLAILSALEPAPSPFVLEEGNRAVGDFLAYLRGLVRDRRAHPGDPEADVLTRLIAEDESGSLPETELLHNCIFLLNAGHETTTNLIGNAMHALLVHRDQFERLRREPALVSTAVEELLRFESPLQLNNRLMLRPIALSAAVVPAGTFITLAIGSANRDPVQFADPDRLDIGRRPNRHLAFGHGDHACAGMNVARLEARIAILALVSRFPHMDLAGAPVRDRRVRFRGFRHLHVSLH